MMSLVSGRNLLFLAVVLGFTALVWWNSLLPSMKKEEGRYTHTSLEDYVETNFTGSPHDQAVAMHEFWHSFKQGGMFDIDVPTAAAIGYWWEWKDTNTLHDSARIGDFKAGLTSDNLNTDVMILIDRYRDPRIREDERSYADGAKLAGIVFKMFGKDEGKAISYMMLISSLCDHAFAAYAVENGKLASFLINFRHGQYVALDADRLDKDLDKLDEKARNQALNYIEKLSVTHTLGFRRVLRSAIGPLRQYEKHPLATRSTSNPDEESELAKLQGAWWLVSAKIDGVALSKEKLGYELVVIKGDVATIMYKGEERKSVLRLDPTRSPKRIDETNPKTGTVLGIYELGNNKWTQQFARLQQERPTSFDGKGLVRVFQRERPPQK